MKKAYIDATACSSPSNHERRITPSQLEATCDRIALLRRAALIRAQDTRTVLEQRFPAPCSVLTTRLADHNGALPESSESIPDTSRIQDAFDRCDPARQWNCGPPETTRSSWRLQLKGDVTLLVEAGAAIFASQPPPTISRPGVAAWYERGHSCKPLITVDRALGSGIMGDGVIDDRGEASLLRQNVTWWDLAHAAGSSRTVSSKIS